MRALAWAFALIAPLRAFAQDYPTNAILYGTVEDDSMTVTCDAPVNERMHCSFTQVSVSHKGNAEEFEKKLPDGIASLLKQGEDKDFSKMCQGMDMLATAIRTGVPPKEADPAKFAEGIAKFAPKQKEDFLSAMDHYSAFCKTPNKQTAESLARTLEDKDERTCKVRSNSFEQTFTTSDFGKTWIANDGPSGECGFVVISKFEKAKDTVGQSLFWTYSTRKIISNKDAKALGLLACSGFDERQFFYDWKAVNEKFFGCDYVEFGF